jgi:putative methionine-R-sulfoxide reductase with GAF domain
MVTELNSFGNPEFLKDPEFINDALSATDSDQHQTESQARSVRTEWVDPLAEHVAGATSTDPASDLIVKKIVEKLVLEQACLVTGATGAAIALVRGERLVCRATTGPNAPKLGVCLDGTGLLGSCIQTRQLRHCNDTETDGRVDAEACRHLGVRSIVVLPLMDGDELFGVFAILSPQPNAFGKRDLDSLQALADRILESTKRVSKTTAPGPSKGFEAFRHRAEDVVPGEKISTSQSESGLRRRKHRSRGNDMWTPILGVLVIGAALLLGTVVGWRLGWQKAALGVRERSVPHRVTGLSDTAGHNRSNGH